MHNRTICLLACCLAAFITSVSSWSEEGRVSPVIEQQSESSGSKTNKPPVRIVIMMVDGSRLCGTAVDRVISVKTGMGMIRLPVDCVRSIGIQTNAHFVSLNNGDHFSGIVEGGRIEVQSIVGRQVIGLDVIEKILFSREKTPPAVVEEGLVLYYSFDANDQTVPDMSGCGNEGHISGARWLADGGLSGGAFDFGGNGAFIRAKASESLNVTTQLTLSVWFNVRSDSTHQPLVEWHNGRFGVGVHMWLYVPTFGTGANIVQEGAVNHFAGFGNKPTVSVWHHMVISYDGVAGQAVAYLDGVKKGTYNLGVFIPETRYDLYIGHRPSSASFDGKIDEVRIYSRVLSDREVGALYNQLR